MGYGPLWRKIAFRGYFSFHFLKEYIIKFKFQFFSSNVPSRGEEFKIEFDYVPSRGFPSGSEGKEFSCNAGDMGLIPGSGRSPGGGIGLSTPIFLGFPGGSDGKESACNVGDLGLIPGLGSCPGGGHGNPLHYSCLEKRQEEAGELQSMGL